MKENVAEACIGGLVVLVAAAFLVFMGQSSGFSGNSGQYDLVAKFRSAEGVVVGSDVRMAGVKIGSVTDISLDPQTYLATTKFTVADNVKVPDDSEAGIATEGLLGGAFVELSPGGSEFMLASGDEVLNTQSAVSLLQLLMQFASGSGQ